MARERMWCGAWASRPATLHPHPQHDALRLTCSSALRISSMDRPSHLMSSWKAEMPFASPATCDSRVGVRGGVRVRVGRGWG